MGKRRSTYIEPSGESEYTCIGNNQSVKIIASSPSEASELCMERYGYYPDSVSVWLEPVKGSRVKYDV